MNVQWRYLLGCLTAGFTSPALIQPAWAQEQPGTATQPQKDGLQDIIVTARRQSESLQKAPVQVDVVSGADLAAHGVTEMHALQGLIPNLNIGQAGPYTQLTIRGVGSTVTTPLQDSGVAFNLDDVNISRPTGTHGMFYDLERVELLKGPQGTLYGRNATAGALNVITIKPVFKNAGGFSLEYGNYDSLIANAFANLKLSDALAIRFAGQTARHDGYYSDGYSDEDSAAGRVQLRIQPSAALDVLLGADYGHEGGKGYGFSVLPFPGNAWDGPTSPAVQTFIANNLQTPYNLLVASGDTNMDYSQGRIDHTNYGFRGSVNAALGPIKWLTIASYRVSKIDDIGYVPGFAFAPDVTSRQVSLETRFSGTFWQDRLKWSAGAYYFKETQRGEQLTSFVNTGALDDPSATVFGGLQTIKPLTDMTYAVFSQNSFAITERLRIVGGLRWLREVKRDSGTTVSYYPFPPISGAAAFQNSDRLANNKVNYRVGVEFDATANSMLYATVADGYKAGGFYAGAAPSSANQTPNSYKPEEMVAYTAGSKNRFFDNRLQVNAEIFYWKYSDRQFVTFGDINTGTSTSIPGSVTLNVGRSHIQGASLDLKYLVHHGSEVRANVEYIDQARNDTFRYASTTGAPAGCTSPATDVVDCSGTRIPFTPTWTFVLGYHQDIPLGIGHRLELDLSSKVQTHYLLGTGDLASQHQSGFSRSDASLTYSTDDDNLRVGAFVRNLENHAVLDQASISPVLGVAGGALMAPRTYGIRMESRF